MNKIKKPRKILKVDYELLFYSGTMPRSLKSKSNRILLARVVPNGTKSKGLESGEAGYAVLTVNNIPCSFAAVGHTKMYDVTLGCTYLLKGDNISVDVMTA